MKQANEAIKAMLKLLIGEWTTRLAFQAMSEYEAEELTKSIHEANKLLKELSHDSPN